MVLFDKEILKKEYIII